MKCPECKSEDCYFDGGYIICHLCGLKEVKITLQELKKRWNIGNKEVKDVPVE